MGTHALTGNDPHREHRSVAWAGIVDVMWRFWKLPWPFKPYLETVANFVPNGDGQAQNRAIGSKKESQTEEIAQPQFRAGLHFNRMSFCVSPLFHGD